MDGAPSPNRAGGDGQGLCRGDRPAFAARALRPEDPALRRTPAIRPRFRVEVEAETPLNEKTVTLTLSKRKARDSWSPPVGATPATSSGHAPMSRSTRRAGESCSHRERPAGHRPRRLGLRPAGEVGMSDPVLASDHGRQGSSGPSARGSTRSRHRGGAAAGESSRCSASSGLRQDVGPCG